ncbi:LLM class flavin-dependent oxidoreductase [Nocardia neocaledoniensis]|uniref:LLM class flavin-dependent oxidoreductase n=1 Tax=Nocardia neocaledoniensis TaxID=236511 RepID=UPI0024547127|nr:LLM class flavin-dependent oxidoreductase [Nocardia neocaledoniensis]
MRFGIILTPRSGTEWTRAVVDAEQRGYDTLLLPDTLYTPSPLPVLAAAAAVTTTLRLRPNVLAAPLRTAAATVREVAALQLLSDGRFELGIGTGRPDAEREAESLGMPWGSAAERREHLLAAVAAVRARVDPAPPVVVAANGPRALATAAAVADRVLLAAAPDATVDDLARMVGTVTEHSEREVRFTLQLVGIGDQMPTWLTSRLGYTPGKLRDAGAATLLPGDPEAAMAILESHRVRYGIDELIVPGDLADAFAPVMTLAQRA